MEASSIPNTGTDRPEAGIALALDTITSTVSAANATRSAPIPPLTDRLTVFCIYFFFALAAILLHVMVALAIVKTLESKKFHSFHILTMNLYFTDTLTFVVYAFYGCPCIILSYQIYGDVGAKIMGAFQTAGFVASIVITFLISMNRALAISQNRWNKRMFQKKNCYIYGATAWILGGLAMVFNWYVDCYVVMDEKMFNFKTVCYSGAPPLTTPSSIAIYVGVYGVGAFYVHAGYALYRRYIGVQMAQAQQAARAHRTRLLFQAFFIWLSLLANVLVPRIVNTYMSGMWAVVTSVMIVFWSRSVPPICMLIFAADVRLGVMKLCGYKVNMTQVVPLQDGATGSNNGTRPNMDQK